MACWTGEKVPKRGSLKFLFGESECWEQSKVKSQKDQFLLKTWQQPWLLSSGLAVQLLLDSLKCTIIIIYLAHSSHFHHFNQGKVREYTNPFLNPVHHSMSELSLYWVSTRPRKQTPESRPIKVPSGPILGVLGSALWLFLSLGSVKMYQNDQRSWTFESKSTCTCSCYSVEPTM